VKFSGEGKGWIPYAAVMSWIGGQNKTNALATSLVPLGASSAKNYQMTFVTEKSLLH